MKVQTSALLKQATGDMLLKMKEELREEINNNHKELDMLKEWLRKQPHLPDEFDDLPLLNFLRGCSFSQEKAKKKLDMYFTMRGACPELFTNRDPTRVRDVVRTKIQATPFPDLTPNARRINVCRGLTSSIETHEMADGFKFCLMVGDIRLMEEIEGVAGDILVLDAALLAPQIITKLAPSTIKKFLICVQEAYPVKLKEIHVINTSILVERIMVLIKPFLKDKIKKRIFVHRDVQGLYKHVPQELLPTEYGGNAGSMDDMTAKWLDKLVEYKDWFKVQESVQADECRRPGKPTNYDELFGIEGSFKQLEID